MVGMNEYFSDTFAQDSVVNMDGAMSIISFSDKGSFFDIIFYF